MSGSRFVLFVSTALTLAFLSVAPAAAQGPHPKPAEMTEIKIYSLAGLGDETFCQWVITTIPELLQAENWKGQERLKYHAATRILVINHTPAVHARVEEFLQGLRKAIPAKATVDAQVVPAQFVPEAAPSVLPRPSSYPVPMGAQTPRHLFHFIIRYEGDGIIDSNVVKFTKAMNQEGSSSARPSCVPLVPAPPVTSYAPTLPVVPAAAPTVVPEPAPRRMPPADGPSPSPPVDQLPFAIPMFRF